MAISTNAIIDFFGTEDQLTVASPGAVNSAAFSVTGDVNDWTNDDDAPWAMFKLKVTATGWSGAPTAEQGVNLYARLLNIEGTEDNPTPGTSNLVRYLGTFVANAADADQVLTIGPIRLPNYKTSQEYEFFIQNSTSVNIASNEWDLWITPTTYGPHP